MSVKHHEVLDSDALDEFRKLAAWAQATYEAQPFRILDEIEHFDPIDEYDWSVAANVERRANGGVVVSEDIAERVPTEQIAAFIAQSFTLVPTMALAIKKLTAEVERLRACEAAQA